MLLEYILIYSSIVFRRPKDRDGFSFDKDDDDDDGTTTITIDPGETVPYILVAGKHLTLDID